MQLVMSRVSFCQQIAFVSNSSQMVKPGLCTNDTCLFCVAKGSNTGDQIVPSRQVLSQAQICPTLLLKFSLRVELGQRQWQRTLGIAALQCWKFPRSESTVHRHGCTGMRTEGQQISEEPQGNTLWSNPMEANGVFLQWRPESSHKDVDQSIHTALHLPLTLKKKLCMQMTRLLQVTFFFLLGQWGKKEKKKKKCKELGFLNLEERSPKIEMTCCRE